MNSKPTFKPGVTLALAGVLTLLVVNAALSYRNVRQLNEDARWVAHTHEVIDALEETLGRLRQAESEHRTYLITGDGDRLADSTANIEAARRQIERVRALTGDNPGQQARIPGLEKRVLDLSGIWSRTARARGEQGLDAARELLRADRSREAMAGLQDLVREMDRMERELLRGRLGKTDRAYATAVVTGVVTTLLGLAAVGMFVGLLMRSLRARQQAAAVLHEQRQLLHATLTSIGDAVIATDAEGRVTFLNPVAQQLTGWTLEAAEGQPLDAVFHIVNEDTRKEVENPALRALREGRIIGLANHTVLLARDGAERPIDDSAAPIRDADGTVAGAVLVFRDIGEKKRAEEENVRLAAAADQQRRIYESALSNTPDFQYVELLRKQPAEMVGRNFHDLDYPPDLAARLQRQIQQVIETRQRVQDETPYTAHLGERQYEYIFVPVLGAGGAVEAVVGSTRDITERKQLEHELRKLAADLSEADRRKDEFLATLAHEIRNPLAPIRNGLQVLRLTKDREDLVEKARAMMERQLGQLVHLVDDLLDVSRISRGKLELRRERVELAAVVNGAVETSRPLIDAGGHQLTVSLPSEPVFVDADVTRLGQVFANLLNNAAKYSDRGGSIRLTVEPQGGEVVVSVQDRGVGIPPHMLPRIFDLFTQVDRSLERSQGGLGIGLTLVKRLVEMHGGSVEARSEGHGLGSELVVRLPVISPAVQPPAAVDGAVDPSPQYRVLVADDNVDSAASLAMMLEIMGNEVRTANDGLQAVEEAAAFRPDLILLDIGMPRLNGYEACRAIREQPDGGRPVIVACTGWGQDEDRRRSREAGFNVHLVKPVDPADLEKLLAGLPPAS
jgi:PAS domain S-box-containing protein